MIGWPSGTHVRVRAAASGVPLDAVHASIDQINQISAGAVHANLAEVSDDVDEDYRLDEMAVVVRSDLTGPCRTESVGVAGCASMAFRSTEYVHFFGGVLFVKPGLHGAVIAHEIWHGVGLHHVTWQTQGIPRPLMNPASSPTLLRLSDVEADAVRRGAHVVPPFAELPYPTHPARLYTPEDLAAYAGREGFDWRFAMADASLYRLLQERFGVAAGQRRYMAWRDARTAAVEQASRPSLEVRTVTEWTRGAALDDIPAVDVVRIPALPGRPAGPRFGSLVHAALATAPLDAAAATIARIVETEGRIVGASADEVAAATPIVETTLAHPLLAAARRAHAAGRLYRETPVTFVAGGTLLEGTVDLAFEDEGTVTVLDFKTDRAEGESLTRYQRQVGLYARAIGDAMSLPTRAVLLMV